MIEISDEYMIATIDGQIVATARSSCHAAADGNGAWIASTRPRRLLSRDKAISAMSLASLLPGGRTDDDPHVISLRGAEVVTDRLIRITSACRPHGGERGRGHLLSARRGLTAG